MNTRVTGMQQTNNAIAYMRLQSSSMAKYQDQISSGYRVKSASDDPARFPALQQAKADASRFGSYVQTMSDSTADLNAGVSALLDANQILVRAKQIAQEGINSTTEPEGHAALAHEVDDLIERMVAAGNAQVDGKYLFGGTATTTPPFAVNGVSPFGGPASITYAGAAERARVLIGPGQTVDTRYAGDQVFQTAGADAFQSLIGLRDALRDQSLSTTARAQALTQSLADVDAARNAIGDTTGEQSSHLARLESLQARVTDMKLAATTRQSDLESTDYAEAIVKMNEQQSALQATMAITARLFQPSFLDFMQ